jgi:hypothetical protein
LPQPDPRRADRNALITPTSNPTDDDKENPVTTTREVFDRHKVLPLIGALDVTSLQVRGEVVYVAFSAHSDGRDDLAGTDTFVIRDGLVQVHTFYATTESPTADDQS